MKKSRIQAGFSLIEAIVVVAIILIMVGVAVIQIAPTLKGSKSQTALESVLGQMRRYHEAAVDQRTIYELEFDTPRTLKGYQIIYNENTKTYQPSLISSIDMPTETQFICVSGIPTAQNAVPDGFGDGKTAIDFDVDYGGGVNTIYFQKDGRATDSNGRLSNGVVYIAQAGDVTTSKAISIFGATGRLKGWRLTTNSDGTTLWRSL